MQTAYELPKYHELSDAELGQWSPEEFADRLLERSFTLGEQLLHKDGWEIVDMDEETKRKGLAQYCIRLAWLEYWNGVNPPAKQIVMMEKNKDDIGLCMRLSQQIIDEVNHQRIWSSWVKIYGGNPKIQEYEVDEDVYRMYRATFDFDDPAKIAATLQCTGEAILSYHLGGKMDPKDSISYQLFPEDLREDIAKRVVAEEPRHIAVGRDIIIKYGGDVKKRRELLHIQINKMKAWLPKAVEDLRLIGAERKKPLPIVD